MDTVGISEISHRCREIHYVGGNEFCNEGYLYPPSVDDTVGRVFVWGDLLGSLPVECGSYGRECFVESVVDSQAYTVL